ncbi:MAG: rod shape-determining protein MreD [Acidobacteria bacterium RIFCSPLOWO2_12_FULL_65_11]|nr:MAG: rod shape-determining protein MreD [Acidobacteria bacterium RIFCSPLOWO2_12_FULL_65_11]
MNAARVFLVVAATLALQTTLARFLPTGMDAVDLVLVGVVYIALTSGPVTGLVTGTCAGLAQDALASGVLGIGGLAKTIVGFAAGRVGTQLIVTATLPRFVVFFGATVVHAVVFIGLYMLLDLRQFPAPFVTVVEQAAGNAILGVLVFQVVELLPGALERRRAAKTWRRR